MKHIPKIKIATLQILLLFLNVVQVASAGETWQDSLKQKLPVMGHRNWIVIADMAYPQQSAPGIETIYTGDAQLDVVKTVLKAIEAAPHVQAVTMLDKELAFVDEQAAPGISAYRDALNKLLAGRSAEVKLHEEIIHQLDADAGTFTILILKTDMVLPYTSVFLRLDCGYWDAAREKELREAMK